MELVEKHPILEFRHGRKVKFTFDGRDMEDRCCAHANGVKVLRYSQRRGGQRAFFVP